MESGGFATVTAVRYQTLWAVRQLVHLLAEELRSVRVEPAGSEGEGIDLIVGQRDGHTEYQQCKRSHGSASKWTLAALHSERVLDGLSTQLRADRDATFALVSTIPAPELADLAQAAEASLDPISFGRDQISASKDRTRAYRDFLGFAGLGPADVVLARDLLRRSRVVLVGDNAVELRDLRSRVTSWVEGDGAAIVGSLESFVAANLRRLITAEEVETYLRDQGYHPRVLARDPRVPPALRSLKQSFEASLAPQMIRGRLLPRDETSAILQLLDDPVGPRFIAVHGPAGVGKSGVLLHLVRELEGRGVTVLPVSLDRWRPAGTPRQFGQALDLPESPARCLADVAVGRLAVLVLDQLDALRWTGGHAAEALGACRDLVDEALRTGNVRVVACCRTFDLETDPQMRRWVEGHQAKRLPVQVLSKKTVAEIVNACGVDPAQFSEKQLDLLSTIQLLRVWEETVRVTGPQVGFSTERQLLDAFWRSRLLEARQMGLDSEVVQRRVNELVEFMDGNGVLLAPRRLLRDAPAVEEALGSLNVLTIVDEGMTFCHQTYLDHQLSNLLMKQLDSGQATVERWLGRSHQGLHRREQLRLVLDMLRQERPLDYVRSIKEVLASDALRFHLKQLVLQFLGTRVEPSPDEVSLVLSLAKDGRWREHVIEDVVFGHPVWFSAAREAGLLAEWLDGDEWHRDRAFGVIRSVVEELGDECHALVEPMLDRGKDWQRRVGAVLPMAPAKDSDALFDLRIRLIETGHGREYLDWKGLGGQSLQRLRRLLRALLPHISDDDLDRHGYFHGLPEVELNTTLDQELLDMWDEVVPLAGEAIGAEVDDDERELIEHRMWRLQLREFLRRTAASLASRDTTGLLAHADRVPSHLGDVLVLETLATIEDVAVADLGVFWLINRPQRLALRWSSSDSPWDISKRAIERLTRRCSAASRAQIEAFLLGFDEPGLRRSLEHRHELLLDPPGDQPRFAQGVLSYPSVAGQTAHHLLHSLPADQRSDAARRRLLELERKFADVDDIFFSGRGKIRSGSVGSPLPADRLNALSDHTWLGIISDNPVATGRWWSRGYRDGKFEEASPQTFAADLQTATSKEPRRFAGLALRIPAEANPIYVQAIVAGLRAGNSREARIEDVDVKELEGVLELQRVNGDESVARDVVWLVESRADVAWSAQTLSMIAAIATSHPDPRAGELTVHSEDWEEMGPRSLAQNALNCTRGAAVYAIAKLLWADPKRLAAFGETLDRVSCDPHPAVRAAVFECCLATLDRATDRSIAWALRAVEGHEALLALDRFVRFMRYALWRRFEQVESVVHRMLASPRSEVLRVGASLAVAAYLTQDRMQQSAMACVEADVARRCGAAEVAAALADAPQYHSRACELLLRLINDESDEVLKACDEAFRGATLGLFADREAFVETYAASLAFARHPEALLRCLREHAGSLLPFADCILVACRNLAASFVGADVSRRHMIGADYYLPTILLRLYEQSANALEVRDKALDSWDILLDRRLLSARELMRQLDEG